MRKVFLSFLCLFSLCLWGQESNVRIGAKAGLSLATFSRGFFYQVEDFAYVPSLYAGATLESWNYSIQDRVLATRKIIPLNMRRIMPWAISP